MKNNAETNALIDWAVVCMYVCMYMFRHFNVLLGRPDNCPLRPPFRRLGKSAPGLSIVTKTAITVMTVKGNRAV